MIFKTFWILFLIPVFLILVLLVKRWQRPATLRFSSTKLLAQTAKSWKVRLQKLPFILRLLVLILFCVALAGPRTVKEESVIKSEGIDIVLALDASGSMAAEDFRLNNERVNRLAIVKHVVSNFIDGRSNDRLGLVAFGGLAYTVCPLTSDYSWVEQNLERIELGLVQDKTAIGAAIMSSLERLRRSDAKSKIIILLTDGVNTAGDIEPLDAARAAQAFGIKIYTIGAGSEGKVPYPMRSPFGRTIYRQVEIPIDEDTLKEIASITDGKYYRAMNSAALQKIYDEIDELEKTEYEEFGYREYKELFPWVLAVALGLLGLEMLLSHTILMRVP